MSKNFEPKGEDIVRQEVVEDLKGDNQDWKETEHEEQVDRITKRRMKDETMKTSLHEQKTKAKKDTEKTKAHFKGKGKTIKGSTEALISAEDKSYLFGSLRMSRTEVRHLEKVMKSTSKDWEGALKDNLYTTWKKENDKVIKRRGSQLSPGSGGSSGEDEGGQKEMVKKFSKNLPKGFSGKIPKKKKE